MPEVTDSTEPGEPSQDSPPPAEGTTASLASRRRRKRLPKEPTQEELDALPVKERRELIDRRRASIHQALNSIGILFGVLFTAVSLVATALSVRTTQRELQNNQNELRNSREGQITDRYTKAVEQLGSNKLDIRLGGIFALERLATDSPRDDPAVYGVLCAFVRERVPLPPKLRFQAADDAGAQPPKTDIQAALFVIGRRKPLDDGFNPDLSNIRIPHAALALAKLSNADLSNADLTDADLTGADLTNADLTGAHLTNADLTGADLRGVQGITSDEIRKQAHVDSQTRFR